MLKKDIYNKLATTYENSFDVLSEEQIKVRTEYFLLLKQYIDNPKIIDIGFGKLNTLKIQKNTKHAIIFGNEVKGVSQKAINLSNDVIEISQFGTKHSLNVSTCSAILIWEFFNALT